MAQSIPAQDREQEKEVAIVSLWYLDDPAQLWLAELWRQALRRFAPGVPVLLFDHGGPIPPPFADVEVIPGAPDLSPNGRGTYGHLRNYWRGLTHAFELLARREVRCGVYIEQDVVVGVPFVEPCREALRRADFLFNVDCMHHGWAFTEYLAGRPERCQRLAQQPFPPGPFDPERGPFSEQWIPRWAGMSGLRTAPFPALWHERDGPLLPTDTFTHHCPREEVEQFARERGIL